MPLSVCTVDFRDSKPLGQDLSCDKRRLTDFVQWSTGKPLNKDPSLQRAKWSAELAPKLMTYAALDVLSAVRVWRTAIEQGLMLPPQRPRADCCGNTTSEAEDRPPLTGTTGRKRKRQTLPDTAVLHIATEQNERHRTRAAARLKRLRKAHPSGIRIQKMFGDRVYVGTLMKWWDSVDDVGMCHVVYDDGDEEEMSVEGDISGDREEQWKDVDVVVPTNEIKGRCRTRKEMSEGTKTPLPRRKASNSVPGWSLGTGTGQ